MRRPVRLPARGGADARGERPELRARRLPHKAALGRGARRAACDTRRPKRRWCRDSISPAKGGQNHSCEEGPDSTDRKGERGGRNNAIEYAEDGQAFSERVEDCGGKADRGGGIDDPWRLHRGKTEDPDGCERNALKYCAASSRRAAMRAVRIPIRPRFQSLFGSSASLRAMWVRAASPATNARAMRAPVGRNGEVAEMKEDWMQRDVLAKQRPTHWAVQ